jgi:putative membrane protein
MPRYVKRGVSMTTLAALWVVAIPRELLAHTARPISPTNLWRAWTFEPIVVALLVLSAILYAVGLFRLWTASETGAGVSKWRAIAFGFGWAALAVALLSPLHALGGALFSAHMTQHELLISVGAPLLVLGRPLIPFLWALPQPYRRTVGGFAKVGIVRRSWEVLTLPSIAFALHAVALWVWHLPGPYQATLTSDVAHSLQHASFLATALLFWWTIFSFHGGELARGRAIFYLFATVLQTGALGALLTFAQTLWYPAYASTTAPWGLAPLEDQQLGGLIMWIPGSLAYLVAALAIFAEWLRDSERRSVVRERAVFAARNVAVLLIALTFFSCDRASGDNGAMLTNADAGRGRTAIKKYGCGSCHTIPGIGGANGLVGPPLSQIASRVYIAGVLPNEPDNMIRWIENPPSIDPKTAMPNMGVTVRDARDIAAYLYTLR